MDALVWTPVAEVEENLLLNPCDMANKEWQEDVLRQHDCRPNYGPMKDCRGQCLKRAHMKWWHTNI